jgi:hypothetical protein
MGSHLRRLCLSVKIQFILHQNINYGMGSDILDVNNQISAHGEAGENLERKTNIYCTVNEL